MNWWIGTIGLLGVEGFLNLAHGSCVYIISCVISLFDVIPEFFVEISRSITPLAPWRRFLSPELLVLVAYLLSIVFFLGTKNWSTRIVSILVLTGIGTFAIPEALYKFDVSLGGDPYMGVVGGSWLFAIIMMYYLSTQSRYKTPDRVFLIGMATANLVILVVIVFQTGIDGRYLKLGLIPIVLIFYSVLKGKPDADVWTISTIPTTLVLIFTLSSFEFWGSHY